MKGLNPIAAILLLLIVAAFLYAEVMQNLGGTLSSQPAEPGRARK